MSKGWLEQWLHTRIGRNVTTLVIGRLTIADHILVHAAGLADYTYYLRDMASIIMDDCAQYGHLSLLRWLAKQPEIRITSRVPEIAALYGQLRVLQWWRPLRDPMDLHINAAKGGHVHVLEWLKSDSKWYDTMAAAAAYNGRIGVLEWLQKHDHSFAEFACNEAAAGGQLVALQWLRVQGCSWDTTTTYNAIRCENVDVLKWAIENGCPCFSFNACLTAIEYNKLGALQWLYARGFPMTAKCFHIAAYFGDRLPILQWMYTVEPLMMHREWQACLREAQSTGCESVVEWLLQIKPA